MKTKLLTSLFFLFSFSAAYSQQTIRPEIKVLKLNLYGFKTLEERMSFYVDNGCIKSDFKGHPEEPKSLAYQSFEYKGCELIYEIFYNDQKEVYKMNMYFGPDLATWKAYTDKEKVDANVAAFHNLEKIITDEAGKATVAKSFTWEPYSAADVESPARYLEGADAKKIGFFSHWFNDGDLMHDAPISIETYNARLVEISVTDWKVQEAVRKAARLKN
jgi:hypothetical protein